MYQELGGYIGYMATPARELQECYLSIVAEMNYQHKQDEIFKREQEDLKRKLQR